MGFLVAHLLLVKHHIVSLNRFALDRFKVTKLTRKVTCWFRKRPEVRNNNQTISSPCAPVPICYERTTLCSRCRDGGFQVLSSAPSKCTLPPSNSCRSVAAGCAARER